MKWIRRLWRGLAKRELAIIAAILAVLCFALAGCIRVPVTVHPPAAADGKPIALPVAPTGEVVKADGSVDVMNPAFDKPTPTQHPPAPGLAIDWNLLIGAALFLITGGSVGYGRVQAKRAEEHKADANEGWSKLLPPTKPGDK